MKKELDYFLVDNNYGGNQNLLRNPFMRIGGCGAVTACDSSIYFTKYKGKNLYPFDIENMSNKNFEDFSEIMRPYLSPRLMGINTLDIYIDGFKQFLSDRNVDMNMYGFSGDNSFEEAKEILKSQIDKKTLVPMLVLKHKNKELADYVWHWFILSGYDEREDGFLVKAVTSGSNRWLDFKALWDNGYKKKGGLIVFDI